MEKEKCGPKDRHIQREDGVRHRDTHTSEPGTLEARGQAGGGLGQTPPHGSRHKPALRTLWCQALASRTAGGRPSTLSQC